MIWWDEKCWVLLLCEREDSRFFPEQDTENSGKSVEWFLNLKQILINILNFKCWSHLWFHFTKIRIFGMRCFDLKIELQIISKTSFNFSKNRNLMEFLDSGKKTTKLTKQPKKGKEQLFGAIFLLSKKTHRFGILSFVFCMN